MDNRSIGNEALKWVPAMKKNSYCFDCYSAMSDKGRRLGLDGTRKERSFSTIWLVEIE